MTNVREEAGKGLTEARQNVGNTLTQVKQDVDNSLTSIREGIAREGHNGIENAGDFIEGVGQIPREVGNHVLGTDSDTKQDLVDENEKTDEEIAQLEFEIEAIKVEIAYRVSDLTTMIELLDEKVVANKELHDALQEDHNELLTRVNTLEGSFADHVNVLQDIEDLEQDVIDVNDRIDNLRVICYRYRRLFGSNIKVYLAKYCELNN